tara:strand:+ start:11748 stop:12035 length:288 start_codon:yes stop_codon:yes gene_type:complete
MEETMKVRNMAVMFVVMLASNYTETSALPDCLRLLDPPPKLSRSTEPILMSRNEQLTGVMRAHRHDTMPTMAVKSRVIVGTLFAAWVVALNVVLA